MQQSKYQSAKCIKTLADFQILFLLFLFPTLILKAALICIGIYSLNFLKA